LPVNVSPVQLDQLMRQAGGQWEPGSRRWLIERRHIGPVIRRWSGPPTRCSGELGCRWTRRSLDWSHANNRRAGASCEGT
jgi:hypothetical protein